ncbi:MAG TPA: hypothetical protein VHV55_13920 [Pirellulales bacterium]|nr:hypothetical protein [Pirellulales bacterium]
MPQSLVVRAYFACHAELLLLPGPNYPEWGVDIWNDLFSRKVGGGDNASTVLDAIADEFQRTEREAVEKAGRGGFPSDWATALRLEDADAGLQPLTITIAGRWMFFTAKMEAVLLEGSYSVTSDEFLGTQCGPMIDTQGYEPGSLWQRLDDRPAETTIPRLIMIRYAANVRRGAAEALGPEPIAAVRS